MFDSASERGSDLVSADEDELTEVLSAPSVAAVSGDEADGELAEVLPP
jgi:Flp pilus assembly secretin CpaC